MDRSFITRFLEKYKSLPCLWKVKSDDYKNKALKNSAYSELLTLTREYFGSADIEFVKKKINNLRTAFRKEYKKCQISQMCSSNGNEVYTPTLWYYDMLYFIADQETDPLEDEDGDMYNISMNQFFVRSGSPVLAEFPEQQKTQENPRKRLFETEYSNHSSSQPKIQRDEPESYKSPPPLHFLPNARQENNLVEVYESFGKYISAKLRSLDRNQRLCAESLINKVLFHASLGELSVSSCVHNLNQTRSAAGGRGRNHFCQSPELSIVSATDVKTENVD